MTHAQVLSYTYVTKKVLKTIKKKHHLWRKWQQNHDDVAYQRYKKLSNKASKKVKQAKKEFEKKLHRILEMIQNLFIRMHDQKLRLNLQLDH